MGIPVRTEKERYGGNTRTPLAVTQMPDFSAIGRGLARQGNQIISMGDQMMARAAKMAFEHDQAAALDAKNKLGDLDRDYRFGIVDGVKGLNAVGLQQKGEEFYTKSIEEVGQTLTNDRQREFFNKHANTVRSSGLDFLASYELQQRKSSKVTILEGNFALAQKNLINPMKPEASETLIQDHLRSIDELNLGTDNTAAKIEAERKMRTTVVSGMIARNPTEAAAYIEKHRAAIGDGALRLEEKIKAEQTKTVALGHADSIWSQGGDEQAMLTKARNISNPDERDQTVNRIKTRFAEKRRIVAERQVESTKKAWNAFDSASPEEKLNIINSQEDPTTRHAMQAMLKAVNTQKPIVTDVVKWTELQSKIEAGEIKNETEILAYQGDLSTSDFQSSMNLWKKSKDPELTSHIALIKENFAAYSGEKVDMSNPKKALKYTQFRDFVLKHMDEKGKTLKALQEATKSYWAEGFISGGGLFGDKDLTFHEAQETGVFDQWIPDVPDKERQDIIKQAKAKGYSSLTEKQIIDVYKKSLNLGGK